MTAFKDMTKISAVLAEQPSGWMHFYCPGCKHVHTVNVDAKNHSVVWGYNGNPEKPTFTPSILSTRDHFGERCHSFVTDGRIQFLGDCNHELAGQTVDLPEWPYGEGAQ